MDFTGLTIEMDPDEAAARRDEWVGLKMNPTEEEQAIAAGYRALAEGHTLIRLTDAINFGGFDDEQRPNLAVIPVRSQWCFLRRQRDGTTAFTPKVDRYNTPSTEVRAAVKLNLAPVPDEWGRVEGQPWLNDVKAWRAMTPVVPPHCRKWGYKSWHILFEAVWSPLRTPPRPPGDPALIQKLGGDLWIVHRTWDLTPLEQAVLAERKLSEL